MGRSRPKLTLWIESCCDGYFDLVYERWWGGLLHPWVVLAVAVMMVRASSHWLWWWMMGGLALVLAAMVMARRREQEVIRRVEEQICVECGYDLRASFDCCPECGTPVPMKNLRRLGLWPPRRFEDPSSKSFNAWKPRESCRGDERRSG